MSYDENNEELEPNFKMGADEDEIGEPLDTPEGLDFGLDEENPERDS
ncbi:MAG: hypothetical protein WCG28_04045 [bacterium]